MTNNQLTDEKIKRRINEIEDRRSASRDFWGGDYEYPENIELMALRELQERRKADSEPVAWTEKCEITNMQATGLYLRGFPDNSHGRDIPLYRHAQPVPELTATVERLNASGYEYEDGEVTPQNVAAVVDILLQQLDDAVQGRNAQPAPERDNVRREHAEWSQATFGDVGPVGPLKHLSKEALEAAADPHDPLEWADMQFLFWDAQRRMGISDEFITRAMIEKLAINKARQWPEPKDGEPRLHIKEQPAPLVTFYRDGIEAAAKWIDQQREAYDSEHGWSDPDTGAFEFGNDAQRGYSSTLEELAEGIRALHPNAGNSPAIPEGYVMVPKEMTTEMMRAVQLYSELGAYAAANLSGAYDLYREFWTVAMRVAPQEVKP